MTRTLEDIERFVLQQMTEDEQLTFEQELAIDQALRKEVDKYRLILEASELAVEDKLRSKLDALASGKVVNQQPKIIWRRYLTLAAGVAILLSVGIWFFGGGESTAEAYAANHYFNYSGIQLRSEDASDQKAIGLTYMKESQWQQAAKYFENYLTQHPTDVEASFMLGDVYYQAGQYSAAMEQWQSIIDQNAIRWIERAQWNYVCAAVANGSDQMAMQMIDEIMTDESHSFHTQASKLANLLP